MAELLRYFNNYSLRLKKRAQSISRCNGHPEWQRRLLRARSLAIMRKLSGFVKRLLRARPLAVAESRRPRTHESNLLFLGLQTMDGERETQDHVVIAAVRVCGKRCFKPTVTFSIAGIKFLGMFIPTVASTNSMSVMFSSGIGYRSTNQRIIIIIIIIIVYIALFTYADQ